MFLLSLLRLCISPVSTKQPSFYSMLLVFIHVHPHFHTKTITCPFDAHYFVKYQGHALGIPNARLEIANMLAS